MKIEPKINGKSYVKPLVRTATALCCLTGWSVTARADDFSLGNGYEGRWSLDLSVGASMRTRNPDPGLISRGNGGKVDGGQHDDGNQNFRAGDFYSALGKAIGEVELRKDQFGVFGRVKGWYDYIGRNQNTSFGDAANGYSRSPINDGHFYPASKFSGVELLDAYGYGTFDLADDTPLKVKIGKHVVNWGESTFIPGGINQYGIVDVGAARRPGAQVKEVLLPIPQISANLGLDNGISFEAFYQFTWERSVLDGCGTFWSASDYLNCSNVITMTPANFADPTAFNGIRALGGANTKMANGGNRYPGDIGQWGANIHYYNTDIGTDFGLYYAQYHARTPFFSFIRSPSNIAGSIYRGARSAEYYWNYDAENIRVVGASAAGDIAGWSVFGEASGSFGVPVQINTNDLGNGMISRAGPMAFLNGASAGTVVDGYDRKNKFQIQVSTVKTFSNVASADEFKVIGEIGYQHWSGIGDPNTSRRYGRDPMFGQAGTATMACTNTNTSYCENEGFATSDALGYRIQLSLTYNNLLLGGNVTPRLFWSHDVSGYSADNTFVEDRMNLGLGVRAEWNKMYYADLSYSTYNRDAKYDPYRDRDFVSLVTGVTF
ncbi:DUF1302 domain-containing protein [Magnetospirillum molischianum]|uniref:DUF1302 domain-containing protein n=1 Tax=Magnetospirillum molischianum DSM 120 TaxID=1150626 RepID=H8FSB0_MAGML|nr:DUF1302 domain-containing protein [Magnetospirillum molischianum]CCG41248.1 conserved exported hypothetical protein [Magnetospirillum molischianum DSM 120]